ncbi:MAG: glycosyltransferase family 4 protein [Vicinamibacterales bacterium]
MADSPVTILYGAWAPFFSGAERALLVLVEHLDPARYRPVVAVGTDGELVAQLRARGVTTILHPTVYREWRHLPSWGANVTRLAWLARRHRAVIAHANDIPSFQPLGYAARIARIPAIAHVRFPDSQPGFSWFLKPGFDQAIFISQSLQKEAQAVAPGLFAASDVVYDGVAVPEEADEATRLRLRAELGFPPDRLIVGLIGQVAEVKGLWDFIDAAQIVVGQGLPVQFVVLGDDLKTHGELRRKAEHVAAERGLSAHVSFLGFRPNAPALMPAFDVVCVPSHVEPLGLSALEAMAAGRTVVASRVGGLAETIVDGQTGMLVPSRDPLRLAQAVMALQADSGMRRRFGAAGRQRVQENFGVAAHARAVQAVYDRLLQPVIR